MAHDSLLALHDVLARYNAPTRVRYPPSSRVARVMEPTGVQARCRGCDCCLGEGVNEILDAARLWAGYTPIDDKDRDVCACRGILRLGMAPEAARDRHE
eukprot:2816012-Karenia_brevis.AAC.1